MLVSHKYRFIYLKTVKTAGTSTEAYFERFCIAPDIVSGSHWRSEHISEEGIVGARGPGVQRNFTWYNHMPAAEIKKRLGCSIWRDYFKFCNLRDPVQRAISAYEFLRNKFDDEHLRKTTELLTKYPSLSNHQAGFLAWVKLGRAPDDRPIYMLDGAPAVDAVIRFEHLYEDCERICKRLGVPWHREHFPTLKTEAEKEKSFREALISDLAISAIQLNAVSEFDLLRGAAFMIDGADA